MSGGPSAGIASGHCPTGVDGPLSISNAPQVVANHKATRISVPILPICGMSPASAASSASAAMIANRAKRPSAANPCDIALPAASLPLRSERTATTGIVTRSAMNARTTPMAAAPLDVDWLRAMAFVLQLSPAFRDDSNRLSIRGQPGCEDQGRTPHQAARKVTAFVNLDTSRSPGVLPAPFEVADISAYNAPRGSANAEDGDAEAWVLFAQPARGAVRAFRVCRLIGAGRFADGGHLGWRGRTRANCSGHHRRRSGDRRVLGTGLSRRQECPLFQKWRAARFFH